MPNPGVLRNLRVKRVSLVDMGANFDTNTGDGAHIMLYKRADVTKDSPSVAAVHVDTIVGNGKKKKENDVKKSLLKRLLGAFNETDVAKRGTEVEAIATEIDALPDDPADAPPVVPMNADAVQKAVAEAVAKAVETVEKANVAKIEALNATIEVEKNQRLDREMVDVLKVFKFAPVDMKTDVAKFRKMRESNPAEYDRVIELLTAAEAQLATSALYKNIGSNLSGGSGDAWTELETLAKALVTKNANGMTKEQALDQVMMDPQNASIVKRYRSAQ